MSKWYNLLFFVFWLVICNAQNTTMLEDDAEEEEVTSSIPEVAADISSTSKTGIEVSTTPIEEPQNDESAENKATTIYPAEDVTDKFKVSVKEMIVTTRSTMKNSPSTYPPLVHPTGSVNNATTNTSSVKPNIQNKKSSSNNIICSSILIETSFLLILFFTY